MNLREELIRDMVATGELPYLPEELRRTRTVNNTGGKYVAGPTGMQAELDRALLRQSLAERVKYPSRRTSAKRTPLGALLRGQAKRRSK